MTLGNTNVYDAVVVGAGIGGLTAGALLARRGLSVLVVERRSMPGGCCSALEIDGYAFDIASSLFYGFGEEGFNANKRVLDELGIELEMFHHNPCLEIVFEGKALPVHEDKERWLTLLCQQFPSCAEGLRQFYDRVAEIYEDILRVGFMPVVDASLLDLARMAFGRPSMLLTYLPVLNQTVWSTLGPMLPPLESNTEVQQLKALMDVDMAFGTCTFTDDLPLLLAVPILMDRHVGGVRYPKGGAGAVPRGLVAGLENHGGQIRYNTTVKRIVTHKGKAQGVELEDGTVIHAEKVICNANIWDTFRELVPEKSVSKRRRRQVEALEPSFSAFITCVAIPEAILPEGFHNHTVAIPDHRTGLSETSIVYAPTVDDPDLAPPGYHAITLVNTVDYNYWVVDGDTHAREDEALTRTYTERALTLAESLIPGIRTHGVVKGTFSPATLERVLRRRYGAVGGPEQNLKQSLNRRQGNQTEIDGLYLVGDSTFPGEGVVAVTISGLTCADQIKHAEVSQIHARKQMGG